MQDKVRKINKAAFSKKTYDNMNDLGIFSKIVIKDDGDIYLMYCDP